MCVETTDIWEPVQSDHYALPVLVLLPSRVRILGWMGPLGVAARKTHSVHRAAQWSVCRAGGAAGPHWPHSPTLHGYRGLYGSPRTTWQPAGLGGSRGAGGPPLSCWSPPRRRWRIVYLAHLPMRNMYVFFFKNVQTAETLLKAYTYKQH